MTICDARFVSIRCKNFGKLSPASASNNDRIEHPCEMKTRQQNHDLSVYRHVYKSLDYRYQTLKAFSTVLIFTQHWKIIRWHVCFSLSMLLANKSLLRRCAAKNSVHDTRQKCLIDLNQDHIEKQCHGLDLCGFQQGEFHFVISFQVFMTNTHWCISDTGYLRHISITQSYTFFTQRFFLFKYIVVSR